MSGGADVWELLREAEQQGRRYCGEMCIEMPTALVKCDLLKKVLKKIAELDAELYGEKLPYEPDRAETVRALKRFVAESKAALLK